MKKLSIVLIILSFCSCRNLVDKHQDYLDDQNRGKFTVNLDSPQFPAGESGAQFDNPVPFAPLRDVDVAILYFPVEDAVCLQYRIDTYTFYQFWSRESREAFLRAFETYNKEFDAQSLTRNRSGQTRKQYGIANGYLIWQMSRFTVRASGHIEMDIGYYFKESAPFFAITQGNAYYENKAANDESRNLNSGERPMYLTRAQAVKIADSFDQQYLQSIVPETLRNVPSASPSQRRQSEPVEYDAY